MLRDEALWRQSLQSGLLQLRESFLPSGLNDSNAVHISIDGSWNPTKGKTGCAAVIRDSGGRWLLGVSMSHSHGSAFLAELLAVELGFNHAIELGHTDVVCFTDCLQVVSVLQPSFDTAHY